MAKKVKPLVAIIMGSDSDLPVMEKTQEMLKVFGIAYETKILSAHRSPGLVEEYVCGAPKKGIKVFIAAAGCAAHLAGVIASMTILPVIGVPMQSKALSGMDSLLSTVQMPSGVPVGTMAIGDAGAKNAAVFAAQILAVTDQKLAIKLENYKESLEKQIIMKNKKLKK